MNIYLLKMGTLYVVYVITELQIGLHCITNFHFMYCSYLVLYNQFISLDSWGPLINYVRT